MRDHGQIGGQKLHCTNSGDKKITGELVNQMVLNSCYFLAILILYKTIIMLVNMLVNNAKKRV